MHRFAIITLIIVFIQLANYAGGTSKLLPEEDVPGTSLKLANTKIAFTSYRDDIGSAYEYQGKYQQGLSYFYQGLKVIREEQNSGILGIQGLFVEEKKGVEAMLLANIGGTYGDLGDIHRALTYFDQALKIRREIGAKYDEAITLVNIALVHYRLEHDYA